VYTQKEWASEAEIIIGFSVLFGNFNLAKQHVAIFTINDNVLDDVFSFSLDSAWWQKS